jgi:hypothetical protein
MRGAFHPRPRLPVSLKRPESDVLCVLRMRLPSESDGDLLSVQVASDGHPKSNPNFETEGPFRLIAIVMMVKGNRPRSKFQSDASIYYNWDSV